MPRRSRVAFAGYPHHIVQRGHNRNPVFFQEFDRSDYLGTLREFRDSLGLKVYAYCLMTNHIHLIVDPGTDARRVSTLMKSLAGRHTRRMNRLLGRSGSLWEGRFHCSPIDTTRYLLTCGRYVDQNPVRAGIAARPEDYRWSSYRARAGLAPDSWLDPDPALLDLAASESRRFEIYRRMVLVPADEEDLRIIRGALQRNQLTGAKEFNESISRETGVVVSDMTPGRPRKRLQTGR
jgi:putative transposase